MTHGAGFGGLRMTFRQKLAVWVVPVILRVLLAATFLWAGLGNVLEEMPVQGEDAAFLANLGGLDAAMKKGANEGNTPALYTVDDFGTPVQARRAMGLALLIHSSAFPKANADGTPKRRLWPEALAGGRAPVVLAWMVTLTELSAGVFLVLGLLTRVWALGLIAVMLGAIWLTEVGPAVQAGATGFLGLLPDRPSFSVEAWRNLLWQFALLMSSVALLMAGPGGLAVDGALFRRRGGYDD
jgi:uncharacterized membrane protein YphA (DoxX/SURF4 family)